MGKNNKATDDNDFVFVPSEDGVYISDSTYSLLVEELESPDAFALYYRYNKQVRLQGTTITESTDSFMEKAMGFSRTRFRKAKNVLLDAGLISAKKIVGDGGKYASWRVEVLQRISKINNEKRLEQAISSSSTEIHPLVEPPTGKTTRMENQTSGNHTTNIVYNNILDNNIIDTSNNNILNNNIDNNNNINTSIIEKENKSKQKKEKELVGEIAEPSKQKSLSHIIISRVYDRISKAGLAYSSTEEDLKFAFILSKDKVFATSIEQVGSPEVLVDSIMDYFYTEEFWKGKITSVYGFYKHWHKIYAHLMVNKKFVKIIKPEQDKKLNSIFDSI